MSTLSETVSRLAMDIRKHSLCMVNRAKASHIGGGLSMADILSACYVEGGPLKLGPEYEESKRDHFFLSKGHACAALYAVLALRGFFELEELKDYGKPNSRLMCHASHKVPGIELSTGSLGHAMPVASGLALGLKRMGKVQRCCVLVSDGEMNEGSNWEALLFAAHHQLNNLVMIVDANGYQGLGKTDNIMTLEPLAEKLRAFGWRVSEIDGHDPELILSSLSTIDERSPHAVIARTVKGKGVSFMENTNLWHYRSPNDQELIDALNELN